MMRSVFMRICEGILRKALSVTCGDSSPGGRAKGCTHTYKKGRTLLRPSFFVSIFYSAMGALGANSLSWVSAVALPSASRPTWPWKRLTATLVSTP